MSDSNHRNSEAEIVGGASAHDVESAKRGAAAAKQRFFALSLFRLSGALILIFGMAISLEHFGWVQGDKAKWMGIIVSTVGFIQFIIVPRILARAFATSRIAPPDRL